MLVSILSRQLDFVSTLWTSNDLKSGKVFYTKILFEKCMFQVLNDKLLKSKILIPFLSSFIWCYTDFSQINASNTVSFIR